MRTPRFRLVLVGLLALALGAAVCSSGDGESQPTPTTIVSDGTPAGDLAAAMSRWASVYPNYLFVLERQCDCAAEYVGPFWINVTGDRVVSVSLVSQGAAAGEHDDYPTIQDLFAAVSTAIAQGTLVDATYDAWTGAPERVEITGYDGVDGDVVILVTRVGEALPA